MAALLTIIERLGGKGLWEFRHWNYNIKKKTLIKMKPRMLKRQWNGEMDTWKEDMTLNNNA